MSKMRTPKGKMETKNTNIDIELEPKAKNNILLQEKIYKYEKEIFEDIKQLIYEYEIEAKNSIKEKIIRTLKSKT